MSNIKYIRHTARGDMNTKKEPVKVGPQFSDTYTSEDGEVIPIRIQARRLEREELVSEAKRINAEEVRQKGRTRRRGRVGSIVTRRDWTRTEQKRGRKPKHILMDGEGNIMEHKSTCEVPGCDKGRVVRGLCVKHFVSLSGVDYKTYRSMSKDEKAEIGLKRPILSEAKRVEPEPEAVAEKVLEAADSYTLELLDNKFFSDAEYNLMLAIRMHEEAARLVQISLSEIRAARSFLRAARREEEL